MHERFGRQWEEKWEIRGSLMWPYPEGYYRLERKEQYEQRIQSKQWVEHWERDGYGYFVTHKPDEFLLKWTLSRTDLVNYRSTAIPFQTREFIDHCVRLQGWRPYEQLTLELEV